MDLFLDDPNIDIDTEERKVSKNIHLLSLIGTFIPPLNFVIPYLYGATKQKKSSFVQKHLSNALNFQLLVLIFMLIGVGVYLYLAFFYFMLYFVFIILFQANYSYRGIEASMNGTVNNYPISINIF